MGNYSSRALSDSIERTAIYAKAYAEFPNPVLPMDVDLWDVIIWLWKWIAVASTRSDLIFALAKGPPPCWKCGMYHWEGRCDCRTHMLKLLRQGSRND